MLTNKGKYGLKALIHLARLPAGEYALSSEIAEANEISKKFLDAILQDLRNGGLVRSRKGPGGGYILAKPARAISVGHAIRVLDGPLAPIACASRTAFFPCEDCGDVKACEIRLIMLQARDAMAEVLDKTSLVQVVDLRASASKRTKARSVARQILRK